MSRETLALQQSELTYKIVTSKFNIQDSNQVHVYGISVACSGSINGFAELADISTDIHDVERLLFKLKKGKVTPDQLKYIVEDFLVDQQIPSI